MSNCLNCGHSLFGLKGVGADATVLAVEVRCPECGTVHDAGTRIVLGGSTVFAMTRTRPLHERVILSIVFGRGFGAIALHGCALLALWYCIVAVDDLLAGGVRFASFSSMAWLLAACSVLLATARFWWLKRPGFEEDALRPDQRDRRLVIGPREVRDGSKVFPSAQVETIRVYECVGAGSGRVVVAVRLVVTTDVGTLGLTEPAHVVIPAGTLPSYADSLVAALHGRMTAAREIGGEIAGETALPRFKNGWVVPATIVLAPAMIVLGALVARSNPILGLAIALSWLALLPFGAEPGTLTRAARWTISRGELSTALLTPIQLGANMALARRAAIVTRTSPAASLRSIELASSHGMPYLVARFKSPFRRARRIVPNDWLGIEPEAFARQVADRIGVPFRDRMRR